MKKWTEITVELNQPPDGKLVRPAQPDKGIFGPYLPAQVVVMYLNEVFGPDGWSGYLTQMDKHVLQDGTIVFASQYDIHAEALNEDGVVMQVSRGNGGIGIASAWFDRQSGEWKPPKSQAIDTAYKGAISDGLKRTAKDFGPKLGMQLYLNETEMALFSLYDGVEHTGSGEEFAPKTEEDGRRALAEAVVGPLVNPKKEWKENPELAPYKNEYGKVHAGDLVTVFGSDAYGYLNWLWPKMEASDKDWDKKAGRELKEWLDVAIVTSAPKAPEKPGASGTVEKSNKAILVSLLKGTKDEAKVTGPIIAPLQKFMAEAGYDNHVHLKNLLKQVSGQDFDALAQLTVKQAKVLVRFADYLIEEGPKSKDFAKEVLSTAFVNDLDWKGACDLIAQTERKGMDGLELEALIQEFDPKLKLVDVAPILSGFGWPLPLPEKQLEDYLKACKQAGLKLFDEQATQVAKAVALQWIKS